MYLGAWLNKAQHRLAAHGETARLEAQALAAKVFMQPRAWVMAHPESVLSPAQLDTLQLLLTRLEKGEPLPYLLGHWEFFGLDFLVTSEVLIPRPETELLVEYAHGWINETSLTKPRTTPMHAIDVGTGSGCIAISLAVHSPDLEIIAADRSVAALEIARKNIQRHQVDHQVKLVACDLLSCFPQSFAFDLICANLPYIPSTRLPGLEVYQHEPAAALDGGIQGMHLIQRLVQESQLRLATGGLLLLEIDYTQGDQVRDLVGKVFPKAKIEIHSDLSGLERLVSIQLPSDSRWMNSSFHPELAGGKSK